MRFREGIILVFDITSRTSFYNLTDWINLIKDKLDDPIIVLFGNKTDIDKSEWKISSEEINDFIVYNNIKYFEVSAKTKKGINEGFNYIADEVLEKDVKEFIVIKPRKN